MPMPVMPMSYCYSPLSSSIFTLSLMNMLMPAFNFDFFPKHKQQPKEEDNINPSLYESLGLSLSKSKGTSSIPTNTFVPAALASYNPFYAATSMNFMSDLVNTLKTPASKTSAPLVNKTRKSSVSTGNFNTKTNLPQLKEVNYNETKGQALATAVANNATGSQGLCAKYVKNAIQNAGLGQYQSGHAYQCANVLRNNPNFKEVKVSGRELSQLPAGCIIVYDQGDAGYSPVYGHIEITLGDGRAASDFITNNIRPSDNAHVFIPV